MLCRGGFKHVCHERRDELAPYAGHFGVLGSAVVVWPVAKALKRDWAAHSNAGVSPIIIYTSILWLGPPLRPGLLI